MTAAGVLSGAQAILKVQVTDALTGLGLPNAKLRVSVRPGLADWFDCPFPVRGLGDGRFVVAAQMREFAARIRTDVTARFRVEIRHRGYDDVQVQNFIRRSEFKIEDETFRVKGTEITRPTLSGAPFDLQAEMAPQPVRLQGVVIRDNDPAAPVSGARVTIDGSSSGAATTNSSGRFLFRSLPVAQSVVIAASKDSDTVSETHFIDFKQQTNAMTLSFKTEPTD